MLIKGSRCEVMLDETKFPGLKFSTNSDGRSEGGRDRQFIVPLITNASGQSTRIDRATAVKDFTRN